MTPEQTMAYSEWANTVSIIVLLFVILITGYRKVWVWGYQLREAQQDRDNYKRLFHRAIGVFGEAVTGRRILTSLDPEEEERNLRDE